MSSVPETFELIRAVEEHNASFVGVNIQAFPKHVVRYLCMIKPCAQKFILDSCARYHISQLGIDAAGCYACLAHIWSYWLSRLPRCQLRLPTILNPAPTRIVLPNISSCSKQTFLEPRTNTSVKCPQGCASAWRAWLCLLLVDVISAMLRSLRCNEGSIMLRVGLHGDRSRRNQQRLRKSI